MWLRRRAAPAKPAAADGRAADSTEDASCSGQGAEAPSPWVLRFAARVPPGSRVLDVACGRGRHARLFAEQGCLVDAVDIDVEAGAALAGVPGIRFLRADLEGGPWPFAGRQFDAIVVTAAAPHVPEALVAQLKPGGRMVIPVDAGTFGQDLLLIRKHADGSVSRTVVLPVRFVPLTGPGVRGAPGSR